MLTSVGDYMGMCTYQYGYNSDGVRISKNMVDWQEAHEYVVNGTTILRETVSTPQRPLLMWAEARITSAKDGLSPMER